MDNEQKQPPVESSVPQVPQPGAIPSFFMKKKVLIPTVVAVVALVLIAVTGFVFWQKGQFWGQKNVASKTPITILWADWAPADSLDALVKEFTKETGIPVVVQRKSWSNFQNYTFSILDAKKQDFDMVVGDSQWLGRGSQGGHYVNLTNFVKDNNLPETMLPIAIEGYGEYPKGSGKYWAVPLEGDALGWVYRKDLFEDPREKQAFQKKYGYELTVPTTWNQVRDIAEFFYRPEKDFYGIGLLTGVEHDPISMGVQNLIWAFGGDLGDYKTHKVKGILNSKDSVAGLEFYKKLYAFTPPGYQNTFYTDPQDDFKKGRLVMFFSYFAFFPELEDKTKNPYSDATGYFKMPKGPKVQVASLGGQGLSISSYTNKKDEAFIFLKWIINDDVQAKWASLGGFSTSKKVLASNTFLEATRFNRAFAESMTMLKDFWADPVYAELLTASQKQWNDYLTKDTSPSAQATMDTLARDWENIFEYSGYYKE